MKKYGSVRIKLDELIEKRGISKNKLCHMAEMERTQLNNFCKNKITRLDTDVLARLCCALECKIEDILEYNPPEETE
jgi:putative transcriptional regulator